MTVFESPTAHRRELARAVFFSFVITFVAARTLVILIMLRKVPDLYFHFDGVHIHHFTYGIAILSVVGGYLLFGNLNISRIKVLAFLYGVGLALAFDEFGMWIHLNSNYWQRATYDAISTVAGTLSFFAFLPARNTSSRLYGVQMCILIILCVAFAAILFLSFGAMQNQFGHSLKEIQQLGPQ